MLTLILRTFTSFKQNNAVIELKLNAVVLVVKHFLNVLAQSTVYIMNKQWRFYNFYWLELFWPLDSKFNNLFVNTLFNYNIYNS